MDDLHEIKMKIIDQEYENNKLKLEVKWLIHWNRVFISLLIVSGVLWLLVRLV